MTEVSGWNCLLFDMHELHLPCAAAPVPKKDLQNPMRPVEPGGRVSPWRILKYFHANSCWRTVCLRLGLGLQRVATGEYGVWPNGGGRVFDFEWRILVSVDGATLSFGFARFGLIRCRMNVHIREHQKTFVGRTLPEEALRGPGLPIGWLHPVLLYWLWRCVYIRN